jgi:ankyrin repeat protein
MKTRIACLTLAALLSAAWVATADSADVARAAQRRDWNAVRELIAGGADVNVPQADGTTALHWAAHWNHLDTLRALLKAGAKAAVANRFGASPLSEAASLGNAEMIAALLEAGADPNSISTADGETVLMLAARAGDLEAVRMLLDRGANVNAVERYKGQTALMWAAAERHAPVVRLLLERGADWKVRSFEHETKMPKLSAASSVTPMPRGGLTALSFAAREGDIATLEAMLASGADINYTDIDNTSPLVTALMNKHYSAALYLLEKGADPNIADKLGRTALYAAIDMRNEDYSALPNRPALDPTPSIEVIRLLLEKGANVNATLAQRLPGRSGMDSGDTTLGEGTTPLMRAARGGDAEVMRLLLKYGADPMLATREGNTALMFAAGVGYRDKNTSGTEAQALEALQVMVELGLDVNELNNRGETALHGAAGRGADTIVQYLVDHGARMDIKSKAGFTPMDFALGKNVVAQLPVPHDSTVALFRKLGAPEAKDLPQTPQ